MHRHRFSGALSNVSGEDKSPLNITAGGTHEGAVLVARDQHGLVPDYVHQVHLCAARKTTHRAYSIERRSVGAVMMASSGCKPGYPQLVPRRHGNLRRLLFPCHNWPAAAFDHLVGNARCWANSASGDWSFPTSAATLSGELEAAPSTTRHPIHSDNSRSRSRSLWNITTIPDLVS